MSAHSKQERIWNTIQRVIQENQNLLNEESTFYRAPRIISILQRLCEHEKAAKEAAEQEDLVSTLDEIA